MLAYLVRRVLLGLLSIWVISIVAFTIVQMPLGDFIDYYVAQQSQINSLHAILGPAL